MFSARCTILIQSRNTEGTLDFQPRVHKFDILFIPQSDATLAKLSGNNLFFTYKETIHFFGSDGTPCTGFDVDATGHISFPGFPDLPVLTYIGDGFGNPGPRGCRIPVDSEGIILNSDSTFWISDEYGSYIYRYVVLFLSWRCVANYGQG
jgi:hypothetical protein